MTIDDEINSDYWAAQGNPGFTEAAAKEEKLSPQAIEVKLRRAYSIRATHEREIAVWHKKIGEDLSVKKDKRNARSDERRAKGKTPRR